MKHIYDALSDATIRMDQMVLLAGMVNDGYSLPDPLRDLLNDDPEVLLQCFKDMPQLIASLEDVDAFIESFMHWAWDTGKWGYVIQFARPVMEWGPDGNSASFSWGYYRTTWVYSDSLEGAVAQALEWAAAQEREEKEGNQCSNN